jgi:ADP-ribosylglycohydrolase
MMTPTDRSIAALIASAVVNALGAPTEFMKRSQIDALVSTNGMCTFLELDAPGRLPPCPE